MTANFLDIIAEIESKPKYESLGGHEDLDSDLFERMQRMSFEEVKDNATIICAHNKHGVVIASFSSDSTVPSTNLIYSKENHIIVGQIGNSFAYKKGTKEKEYIRDILQSFADCFDITASNRFITFLSEKIWDFAHLIPIDEDFDSCGEDVFIVYPYKKRIRADRMLTSLWECHSGWPNGIAIHDPERNGELIYNPNLICIGKDSMQFNKTHKNDNIQSLNLSELKELVLSYCPGSSVQWATMDSNGNIDSNF